MPKKSKPGPKPQGLEKRLLVLMNDATFAELEEESRISGDPMSVIGRRAIIEYIAAKKRTRPEAQA
jgi:hypothetical protein